MARFLLLLIVISGFSFAQELGEAFTLIRLVRKPSGPVASPEAIQAHRAAKVPVDVVGMKSITGMHQVWLIEAHGSFASIEATDTALTAATSTSDAMADLPTIVGLLRPGLSYRPLDAIKSLNTARYFQVTFFRTRPGYSMDFAEVMRIRNAALDYLNLDRPEIGYQIISGAESGTYIFLAPLPSLGAIDNAMARTWGRMDGAGHAARQAASKLSAEADIIREQLLFRVDPRISFVSESFGSAAPEFWGGK